MTRVVRRLRRRLRLPAHMDRFGNYRDPWLPLWEPDPRGETR